MITLLLIASLFLFFYLVFGNEVPLSVNELREKMITYGIRIASVLLFFLFGKVLFQSALSGFIWGFFGWFLPGWVEEAIIAKRKKQIRAMVKNFISIAAGMYSAGMLTPDVVRTMATRIPEPLASDFEEMIGKRNLSANASFPRMFAELADKYGVEELRAVSAIIAAADRVGGPRSASRGLKRLGQALRQQERLATERIKATSQPKIAAIVVISLLSFGLILDVTALRSYYETGIGPLLLSASSLLVIGMFFMYRKVMSTD